MRKIRDIYGGPYSTFLINSKGLVFSCGLNNYGQLGY